MCDGRGSSRRRFLRVGAVGAITAAAGCSGLGSDTAPLEDEEPETHTLTVALEENGQPATEASVSVQSEQLVPQADAKIPGNDGIVTFELENGDYVVLVESQEFSNVDEPVTIENEDVEVTIDLERGYG